MNRRVYHTLQSLAGHTDDPRVQRLLRYFGCSHLSTIVYRVWATDDPTDKQQLVDVITRILELTPESPPNMVDTHREERPGDHR
jgi:hypothetical protein